MEASFSAMDPLFNSSDIELDEEPPSDHVHRGAASIDKLLANPMDRRISSKKFVKTLSLAGLKNAKSEVHTLELWKNRWNAFEKGVLGRE